MDPTPLPLLVSTLESVTVYREGAVCVRRARVAPQAGRRVCLGPLPLSLGPGSLRARVVGGPDRLRVLDVRPQFDVVLADAVDVPAEQRALDLAQEVAARLQVRRARMEAECDELVALRPRFLEPRRGEPPRAAPVGALLALADFTDAELGRRLAARRALDRELADAERDLDLRRQRLAEASTAHRTERARLSRVAVVTLSSAPDAALELLLEYQVSGVRWAPGYQLDLARGLATGTLRLRAMVAQCTGEDWTGIVLSLSTASLARRGDVPELKSLRIGRRQDPPPRSGWRSPPPGLGALFEGYDGVARAMPEAPPPPRPAMPVPMEAPRRRAGGPMMPRAGAPRPPMSMPPPAAMPVAAASASAMAAPEEMRALGFAAAGRPAAKSIAADQESGGGVAAEADAGAPPGSAPEATLDAGLLDYAQLSMRGPDDARARGRLVPGAGAEPAGAVAAAVDRAQAEASRLAALPLPAECRPVGAVESFDYRYDCAARVDIPSTGTWTTVPVMQCAVGLTPEYVCVPAVEPKVYRALTVANRSAHALLPGPVDVTVAGGFLLTATLPAIPPGADRSHQLGLGVEEAIKVARRTQFKESTGGFLAGATVLQHDLEIELDNRLATPARVEVRERVPWAEPGSKSPVVEEPQVVPPWEKVETPIDGVVVRGARRWRVTVPAGQTLKLSAQFTIRIPADQMLVGGNRRA